MNKAQKITMAVVAFIEAAIILLHDEITYYFYRETPSRLMIIVALLGFGIWVLLGLKKGVKE